jgi:hypothetical protein
MNRCNWNNRKKVFLNHRERNQNRDREKNQNRNWKNRNRNWKNQNRNWMNRKWGNHRQELHVQDRDLRM